MCFEKGFCANTPWLLHIHLDNFCRHDITSIHISTCHTNLGSICIRKDSPIYGRKSIRSIYINSVPHHLDYLLSETPPLFLIIRSGNNRKLIWTLVLPIKIRETYTLNHIVLSWYYICHIPSYLYHETSKINVSTVLSTSN